MVGEPYYVGQTLYTPVDTLNYDEVGYATVSAGAMGYSASHHTLPVPSYIEVTDLASGQTVLVRVEDRGPMESQALVALSPAAMAQLGARPNSPIRVRRVTPPEEQRAMLRAGQAAPLRMETPESLLVVLRRKLPATGSASLQPSYETRVATAPAPAANAPIARAPVPASTTPAPSGARPLPPLSGPASAPAPAPVARPAPSPAPAPVVAADGRYVVQAAAFSDRSRADRVARVVGGSVSQAGSFWRVRTGPFRTRSEAEASLAKVRGAGYGDARIFTN